MIAVDLSPTDARATREMLAEVTGTPDPPRRGTAVADAARLCLPDSSVDVVIAAEVFEHLPDDAAVAAELHRVLRPGGLLAVTVPRWFPERICWALTEDYHAPAVAGGHVRIYRRRALVGLVGAAGFEAVGSHHAHALHSPYWWLRCALGVSNENALPTRLYHRVLVWDIMARPRSLRLLEQVLNPVLGKSLVVYFRRLATSAGALRC